MSVYTDAAKILEAMDDARRPIAVGSFRHQGAWCPMICLQQRFSLSGLGLLDPHKIMGWPENGLEFAEFVDTWDTGNNPETYGGRVASLVKQAWTGTFHVVSRL